MGHCSTDPTNRRFCFFSPDVASVQFTNFAGGDYRLTATSPDHIQGSDSLDLGISDWTGTTGVGKADAAKDVEPD